MRLIFALALTVAAASALAQPLPVTELRAGMHLIRAEVASDVSTRSRGLMHRKGLAPNSGMLFIFDGPSQQCMWMKNTYIPSVGGVSRRAGRHHQHRRHAAA